MKECKLEKEETKAKYKNKEYTIITDDEFPINSNIYEPLEGLDKVKTIIMINCGTGINQKYYRKYSEYLVSEQCVVVTWDYRGMGESLTPEMKADSNPLKDFFTTITMWAQKDHKSMIDFIKFLYPRLEITIIGHSVGAQIPLLCSNREEIKRMVCIAVGNPHWKYLKNPFLLKVVSYYGKLQSYFKGYNPGSMGLDDLPKHVYLQWLHWVDQDLYMGYNPKYLNQIRTFDKPILGIAFEDDDYMLKSAFLNWYSLFSTKIPFYYWSPKQFGLSTIAHNGFFNLPPKNERLKEQVWHRLTEWIKEGELTFEDKPTIINCLQAKL